MKLWDGRESRAEVYGLFLAAVVLVGGGIGGAVAMTSGSAGSQSAKVTASEAAETPTGDELATPVPVEPEQPVPESEPLPTTPSCDDSCRATHVSEYLASAKLETRARSAADARLCLVSNCGEHDGRYCIIGDGNLVTNCIAWNGWGDGWLDSYAQGHGVAPRNVFIVDADPSNGIRLSPGEPVSYVGD